MQEIFTILFDELPVLSVKQLIKSGSLNFFLILREYTIIFRQIKGEESRKRKFQFMEVLKNQAENMSVHRRCNQFGFLMLKYHLLGILRVKLLRLLLKRFEISFIKPFPTDLTLV